MDTKKTNKELDIIDTLLTLRQLDRESLLIIDAGARMLLTRQGMGNDDVTSDNTVTGDSIR
jgi:hypothetical protein